jgi:hypothetical protein
MMGDGGGIKVEQGLSDCISLKGQLADQPCIVSAG